MLDVLEFYTDHQKRELEEMGVGYGSPAGASSSSSLSGTTLYSDSSSAPRFNAGTGLGGAGGMNKLSSLVDRPPMKRQDSAPTGLNGTDTVSSTPAALARAAELVNGSAVQHANTISAAQTNQNMRPGLAQAMSPNSLQPSRPAPARPLLANRAAPPAPKPSLPDHTPTSADLRSRAKAQGPSGGDSQVSKPPGLNGDAREQQERRPQMAPSKTSPATSQPASQPVNGAAGATVGPPPIKPLQPKKPNVPPKEKEGQLVFNTHDEKDRKDGGVAAAAAALEKPKEKEKRISTMNEAQIMEKLRSVVCPDNPKALYSKIRKVGQG